MGFLGGSVVKDPPAKEKMRASSLGWEFPLEKEMATRSSILAWRIPWTEEPGRLQSSGYKESDITEQLILIMHVKFNTGSNTKESSTDGNYWYWHTISYLGKQYYTHVSEELQ